MRRSSARGVLSTLLVLILAGGALLLAVRGVDWRQVLTTVRGTNPVLLLVAFAGATGVGFLRSLRWRLLLNTEKPVALLTVFWAVMLGYLGNNYLPARAGEVIRSAALGRCARISTSFVLATTLTERILDAVALVLISVGAILTHPHIPKALVQASKAMGLAGLVGLIGLLAMPRLERHLHAILSRAPLPEGPRGQALDMLGRFLLGMRAVQHPSRASGFAGLTVVIWVCDAAQAMLIAHALGLPLMLPQAMLLLAALGLASAIPSTPGYVGIFQFVGVTVLVPFGFGRSSALAYILVLQAMNYVTITFWGLLGLWRLNVPLPTEGAAAPGGASAGASMR